MTGVDDVLRRWNPHGWRRLHTPPSATVRVVGVPGTGLGSLITELEEAGDDTSIGLRFVRDGDCAVVLLVTDVSAVLGRTEFGVLDGAARGAVVVVCALTAVDLRPGQQEQVIRDRDAELLHRHAPWFGRIDVLPVSAHAAAHARRLGGDVGRVLAVESGIVDLRAALCAAVTATQSARVVRAAVLARTRAMILDEIRSLRTVDDTVDPRTERLRLSSARVGAQRPRSEVSHARTEILHDATVRLRAVASRMSESLDGGVIAPDDIPGLLAAELGDVAAAVADAAAQRWGPTSASGLDEPVGAPVPDPPERAGVFEDRFALVLGVSAGAGLGKLLSTSIGWLPVAPAFALSVACGGVAAWWLVRMRRQLAHRDRIRRWVSDEIAVFRAALDRWIRARAFDVDDRLGRAADERGRERAAALVDRIAEIDEEIRRRDGVRRARIAACERDLATLGPFGTGTFGAGTEPIGRVPRPSVDGFEVSTDRNG